MYIRALRQMVGTLLLTVGLSTTASAEDEVKVLDVTIADQTHSFTLTDLKSMPASSFRTSTIWTDASQVFEGVSLNELLETLDVTDGEIIAIAINDYSVKIPVTDAADDGPIIAYHANGEEMSRRDKGPLWIVYPYDSDLRYQTETIYSRSIWQLDRIRIE